MQPVLAALVGAVAVQSLGARPRIVADLQGVAGTQLKRTGLDHVQANTGPLERITVGLAGGRPGVMVLANPAMVIEPDQLRCRQQAGVDRQRPTKLRRQLMPAVAGRFARGVGTQAVGAAELELLGRVEVLVGELPGTADVQIQGIVETLYAAERILKFSACLSG